MQTPRSHLYPAGPPGVPIFGNAIRYSRDPFLFFKEVLAEYGEFAHHQSLRTHFYLTYSPELIEHVLVRNAKNYLKDPFLRNWKLIFGEGLLTAESDHWRRERRVIQPAFHRDRLARYHVDMRESTLREVASWKDDDTRFINRDMMELTLDIVLKTLFGERSGVDVEAVAEAFEDCSRYFQYTTSPVGVLAGKLPFPPRLRYVKSARKLHAIVGELQTRRRNQGGSGDDLLSTLTRLRDEDGSALSDQQIRDELMTFFLAGHETTALALTYALHLIATHPDWQKSLLSEVDRGSDTPLLQQTLSEALRLYPPAWVLAREAVGPDQLGDFSIPSGAIVVIPSCAIHRHPKFYDHPDEFRPERWTAEFQKKLPRAAYLPFGYGPRMCIGSQFAMQEALIILEEILLRFELSAESAEPITMQPSITARPKADVKIKLKQRKEFKSP